MRVYGPKSRELEYMEAWPAELSSMAAAATAERLNVCTAGEMKSSGAGKDADEESEQSIGRWVNEGHVSWRESKIEENECVTNGNEWQTVLATRFSWCGQSPLEKQGQRKDRQE